MLSWLCHQRPERSPHLWETQLPLCWRCSGILVGLVCFILLLITARRLPPSRFSIAFAALLPLDVMLAVTGVWVGSNAVRFTTGVLWGVCATSLVLRLATHLSSSERRATQAGKIVCGSGGGC